MNLREFLVNHFYKDDLKNILEKTGYRASGNMAKIARDIEIAFLKIPEDEIPTFLNRMYWHIGNLEKACKKVGISTSGTKKSAFIRLINEIPELSDRMKPEDTWQIGQKIGGKSKKEQSETGIPIDEKSPIQRKKVNMNDLKSDIERWTPLKRYSKEEGYHPDLHNFLRDKCGYSTRLEGGEERADIVVNDHFPIELKKNPTQPEYDRLMGQLMRNERTYRCAIAVICDVRRKEKYDDFVANVKRIMNKKVIVIKK